MEDLQFNEKLSEAVSRYPCLFNKREKAFKDRGIKSNGWAKVAEELNLEDGTLIIFFS